MADNFDDALAEVEEEEKQNKLNEDIENEPTDFDSALSLIEQEKESNEPSITDVAIPAFFTVHQSVHINQKIIKS